LLFAVRAHLLTMAESMDAASDAYHAAALRTASLPEKRFLQMRALQTKVT